MDVTSVFDGWGYVRLLDASTMRTSRTYASGSRPRRDDFVGWALADYLGFGVVGFVVVLEQHAPQQFPHAQAIFVVR